MTVTHLIDILRECADHDKAARVHLVYAPGGIATLAVHAGDGESRLCAIDFTRTGREAVVYHTDWIGELGIPASAAEPEPRARIRRHRRRSRTRGFTTRKRRDTEID